MTGSVLIETLCRYVLYLMKHKAFASCAGAGVNSSFAEHTSSIETKQILGYLWTKDLLKKHDKPLPKKWKTIQHQGKTVKGMILEENVVGHLP